MGLDLFIQTIHEQFTYVNINYFDPVYLLRNALVLNVWSFLDLSGFFLFEHLCAYKFSYDE